MSESEAMPMVINASEFMMRAVKEGAELMARLVAFFIAWKRSHPTRQAEESMSKMLQTAHETGTDVVIGKIKQDNRKDFRAYAKEYGLKYHVAHVYKDKGIDFMFLDTDMNKLAAIADRLGLNLTDFDLSLFKVAEMRESIKRKLDAYEKEQRAGGRERSDPDARNGAADERETSTADDSRVQLNHQVSDMSTDDVVALMQGIKANQMGAYSPENWRAYLEMQSMVYNYSPKNKEIIMNAGATLAMSKSNWLALGRRITDDAQGIKIWKPSGKDDQGKTKFEQVEIYDIIDTQGLDIEMGLHFHRTDDETLQAIADYLKDGADGPFRVEEREGLNVDAYFDRETETIFMRKGLTVDEQILALEREHSIGRLTYNSTEDITLKQRFISDNHAFIVCTKLGVDCSSLKYEYLPDLVKEDFSMITHLQKVTHQSVSKHLEQTLEKIKNIPALDKGITR